MELGDRSGLVNQHDDGAFNEEGEEEEEEDPVHDPEVGPSDPNGETADSVPDVLDSGYEEPEAELNPGHSSAEKVTPDGHTGAPTTGEPAVGSGLGLGVASAHDVEFPPSGDTLVTGPDVLERNVDADDLLCGDTPLYNPFDRPEGEVIVQAFSPSRSRSPASRSFSVNARCARRAEKSRPTPFGMPLVWASVLLTLVGIIGG